MAKETFKDYEILRTEDGIYIGRALKNGKISKDARKLDDEEIILIFEDFLNRYCARNITNLLDVQRDGKTVFEAKLFVR